MLSEQTEEQVIKALRDTHRFLLKLDQLITGQLSETANASAFYIKTAGSAVRSEVDYALHIMGKL